MRARLDPSGAIVYMPQPGPVSPLTKAIREPSGVDPQSSSSFAKASVVTCVLPLPSAFMSQIWPEAELLGLAFLYAIFVPSGDHEGERSAGIPSLTACSFVPSAFMTTSVE